jgi:hypothetical protein
MLPLSENVLDEMVALERDRTAPQLTSWDSLSTALRAEGLISDSSGKRLFSRRWVQMAAGLTLAIGGAALGRVSAGAGLLPSSQPQVAQSDVSASGEQNATVSPAATSVAAIPASQTTTDQFQSPEQAWDVLNRAGEDYQRASAYLSANNTDIPMPVTPSQYRTRLVALDNVMSEIRGALKEAPQDPVINQYYLATVGAREATLRQLGTTLRPEGVSLKRF